LAFIFQEYFRLVSPYIFDYFNNPKLNSIQKHVINLHQMLSRHLVNIVDLYINGLQKLNQEEI